MRYKSTLIHIDKWNRTWFLKEAMTYLQPNGHFLIKHQIQNVYSIYLYKKFT